MTVKAILSIVVYFAFVLALALLSAFNARRDECGADVLDDDL